MRSMEAMVIIGQDMVIEVMVDKHIPLIVDQWGEVDMVMVDEVSMTS